MAERPLGVLYTSRMKGILDDITRLESQRVLRAAHLLADAVASAGVVHIFGAGHSQLVAADATFRAGGPAWANGVLDPGLSIGRGAIASTLTERIPEMADAIFAQVRPKGEDATIVITNSGMTPITLRWARLCREHSLPVIGITSCASHGHLSPSDEPAGISAVADVVIDNHCPVGDAAIGHGPGTPEGSALGIGSTSTIASTFVVHWLAVETHAILLERGEEVLAFRSSHMHDSVAHNQALIDRFRQRVNVL